MTNDNNTPFDSVHSTRRVSGSFEYFVYDGFINDKECRLKIDTGSDVSILSSKFIDTNSEKIPIDIRLKYPTGEDVLIRFISKLGLC